MFTASGDSSLGPDVGCGQPRNEQWWLARNATFRFVFSENSSRLLIAPCHQEKTARAASAAAFRCTPAEGPTAGRDSNFVLIRNSGWDSISPCTRAPALGNLS